MPAPIVLEPNQPPDRFYHGGSRIASFRRLPHSRPRTPEDWLASTTALFGHTHTGLTTIGGITLKERIDTDPLAWLGPDHVAAFGTDTRLLVKLLEAGQRLPVHVHPDHRFAAEHLGLPYGKAEAWYIVDPGEVFLGFKDDISTTQLELLVAQQRTEELLDLLHRREVSPGDRE